MSFVHATHMGLLVLVLVSVSVQEGRRAVLCRFRCWVCRVDALYAFCGAMTVSGMWKGETHHSPHSLNGGFEGEEEAQQTRLFGLANSLVVRLGLRVSRDGVRSVVLQADKDEDR